MPMRSIWKIPLGALAALCVPLSVVGSAPSRKVATATSRPGPTEPAGRWYYWADCSRGGFRACGTDSVWVAQGGLWRWDIRQRRMQAFTPMDGLPLESRILHNVQASRNEACVVQFAREANVYLWRPKVGWRSVPPPAADAAHAPCTNLQRVAFGPDGHLYYAGHGRGGWTFYRWACDQGRWLPGPKTHEVHVFVPLEAGFLVWGVVGSNKSGWFYVPRDGGKITWYRDTRGLRRAPRARYEHLDGRTLYPFRDSRDRDVWARVTPTRFVVETGRFGVREADGWAWNGASVQRGGKWQFMAPSYHRTGHQGVLGLAFDPARGTWQTPPARPGWVRATVGGQTVHRLVRPSGAKQEVLRTLPSLGGECFGGPQLRDARGHWWGIVIKPNPTARRDEAFVVRWGPSDRPRSYASGVWTGYVEMLLRRTDAGRVWLWSPKGCFRYDAKADRLVRGSPYEDFAVQLGPWRVAMVGIPVRRHGTPVYRKEGDLWRRLANPFGKGVMWGHPGMIHKDRMLVVSQGIGVLEYDATHDRWALLHGSGDFSAAFDRSGRARILANYRCALVYDGDPFKATAKAAAVCDELLKLMDNPRWRVRDEAMQRLKRLYPQVWARLRAALKSETLSLEVRTRIEYILRQRHGDEGIPLPNVFRTMHPLAAPAVGP